DDDVVPGAGAEGLADLLADARQIGQVEAAVAAARRPDAHEREIRRLDRLRGARRGPGGPRPGSPANPPLQAPPDDGTSARVQARDLVVVDVDADHLMAVAGEGGCRHASHVPQSEHRDIHRPPSMFQWPSPTSSGDAAGWSGGRTRCRAVS